MSDFSTNFQLPYLMPAQAQKHVTVNEALRRLDALCQANAVSMSTAVQPASPADGALYIIPSGKSGADWAGATNWSLGLYADGDWNFVIPRQGWLVWVKDTDRLVRWTGAAWVQVDIVTLATVLTALANGGSLPDPNADRILFWDDSADGYRHLAPSSNFSISGTTLDVGSNVLLESECASPSGVKAINQALATTSAAQFGQLGVGAAAATQLLYVQHSAASGEVQRLAAANASYSGNMLVLVTQAAASSNLFWSSYSSAGGDIEAYLTTSGNLSIDGSLTSGGADRAEMLRRLESATSVIGDWDGRTVTVDYETDAGTGDRAGYVRLADAGDAVLGVVTATYDSLGNDEPMQWSGKYLKDEWGRRLTEPYAALEWDEVMPDRTVRISVHADRLYEGMQAPADAVRITHDANGAPLMREILNPDFDPTLPYRPRHERTDWVPVCGLLGLCRVRKGDPVGDRWVFWRDVSGAVEEWLVR